MEVAEVKSLWELQGENARLTIDRTDLAEKTHEPATDLAATW